MTTQTTRARERRGERRAARRAARSARSRTRTHARTHARTQPPTQTSSRAPASSRATAAPWRARSHACPLPRRTPPVAPLPSPRCPRCVYFQEPRLSLPAPMRARKSVRERRAATAAAVSACAKARQSIRVDCAPWATPAGGCASLPSASDSKPGSRHASSTTANTAAGRRARAPAPAPCENGQRRHGDKRLLHADAGLAVESARRGGADGKGGPHGRPHAAAAAGGGERQADAGARGVQAQAPAVGGRVLRYAAQKRHVHSTTN